MKDSKNDIALIGFACSICGLISMGIISIVGIVLSIIGLNKSKKLDGKNRSYALTGLILGIVEVIICILVVILLIVAFSSEDIMDEEINEKKLKNYNITDIQKYVDEDNIVYIEGILKNNNKKTVYYIDINYETYDEENNITGYCNAYIDKLEKNKTWKFSATCDAKSKDILSYKIKSVTAQ